MNLPFFFFLLAFLRSSGWCRALGSSTCPEETCSIANRELCSLGSSKCGNCLKGFYEYDGACIALESSPNDDSWESDIEGNDDSELNDFFGTTHTTIKKHNKKHRNTPESIDFTTPSAPATAVEENASELSNKHNNLEGKVAAKQADSSAHRTEYDSKQNGAEKSDDFKSKSQDFKNREQDSKKDKKIISKKQDKKEELGRLRETHKKRDEEKLNKFLSEKVKKEDGGKQSQDNVSDEDGMNLEGNSSTNPPPFIRKHKVGSEAKASEMDDIYFLFIVIGCSVAGIAGLGLAGYCWYKLHTTAKAVSEAEYAGHGMKGSHKKTPSLHGDDKLDYNAEMYHYHQTKSQLAAMEKAGSKSSKQGSIEDDENSDEGDEGDYTVYECPGLAPTGDMTVVNPLFSDQEAVGSDQDANGNRSGHSSPTSSRHSSTTKPAE